MRAACIKCETRGHKGLAWHATGRFTVKVGSKVRIAAEIVCDTPGCGWSGFSLLEDGLEAGQRKRAELGLAPYTLESSHQDNPIPPADQTPAVRVPAPTLFGPMASQHAGMVPVARYAKGRTAQDIVSAIRDHKQLAGKDEA